MPDNGSQDELTLRRMPEGGFLVMSCGHSAMPSMFCMASTSIDEALAYMKAQINPIHPASPPAQVHKDHAKGFPGDWKL